MGKQQVHWLCFCSCGKYTVVRAAILRSGHTRSCGCLQKEVTISRSTKHGHARKGHYTREYDSWRAMVARCTNPNFESYKRYGGRGITVCDRWRNSFENFLQDLGARLEGTTLGRFGDQGNYEPGNCMWMTRQEQVAEQKKKRMVECVMREWQKAHNPAVLQEAA